MHCDIEANWLLNQYCNYQCAYCYNSGLGKKKAFRGLADTKKIIESFDNTGFKWLIYMSGGEPFFFPNFIDLCRGLTKKHIIGVNTNLTHNAVDEFADLIPPQRVSNVHCSIHITELERRNLLNDFFKKFHYLKSKGFYVFASYVLYPPLLKRFEKDYRIFKSQGVIIRPKLYRGVYAKRRFTMSNVLNRIMRLYERAFFKPYPKAYTYEEKQQILFFIKRSQEEGGFKLEESSESEIRISDVYQDQKFISDFPSFKGQACGAGKNFVRILETGNVYRCHSDKRYLGNLFKGTLNLLKEIQPCRVPFCRCPYFGYRYVLKNKINNVNAALRVL